MRFAVKLSNDRYVSVNKGKGVMLYSSNGKNGVPPSHYTSSNIFKVLGVRKRVLNGEAVHRTYRGAVTLEYFDTCVCVRV